MPCSFRRGDKFAIGGLATELGIDLIMVAQVVAVRAARLGPQIGRAIHVADSQVAQIGHERRGVVQGEAGVELQAIGCRRPDLTLAQVSSMTCSVTASGAGIDMGRPKAE